MRERRGFDPAGANGKPAGALGQLLEPRDSRAEAPCHRRGRLSTFGPEEARLFFHVMVRMNAWQVPELTVGPCYGWLSVIGHVGSYFLGGGSSPARPTLDETKAQLLDKSGSALSRFEASMHAFKFHVRS